MEINIGNDGMILSCSQSMRLGLFYEYGINLVAVLLAALLFAIDCQESRLISLCFMFRFSTSLNLKPAAHGVIHTFSDISSQEIHQKMLRADGEDFGEYFAEQSASLLSKILTVCSGLKSFLIL